MKVKVLYVEERDPDDAEIFKDAIQKVNPAIEFDIARGYEEALYKLNKQSLPSIIFLDVNRHSKECLKCLETIKQDPILKSIPVIIYSTSKEIAPFNECFKLGASGYIIKPNSFKGICQELESILKNLLEQNKNLQ